MCVCVCQRGRGKRQDRVATERKDGLEKDGKADSLSGGGAVNSAGVVYVKILVKVS